MVITPIKPLEPMTGTAQLLSALTALASHLNCAQLGTLRDVFVDDHLFAD